MSTCSPRRPTGRSRLRRALLPSALLGVVLVLGGCDPFGSGRRNQASCASYRDCLADEICAAGYCQPIPCQDGVTFARDPRTGKCVAILGCTQREYPAGWELCDNPCAGLGERECFLDSRCEAVYEDGHDWEGSGSSGGSAGCGGRAAVDGGSGAHMLCRGEFKECRPRPQPVDGCQGLDELSCVRNPLCRPLYGGEDCGCPANALCECGRSHYQGCMPAECMGLAPEQCVLRADCELIAAQGGEASGGGTATPTTNPPTVDAGAAPTPPSEGDAPPGAGGSGPVACACDDRSGAPCGCPPAPLVCVPRAARPCEALGERECLARPDCHPVGEACYCPPDGRECFCGGGRFLRCEPNGPQAECVSDADCPQGMRCNAGEICLPVGDLAVCGGLCVPGGDRCQGLSERDCRMTQGCEPVYGQVPCDCAGPADAGPGTRGGSADGGSGSSGGGVDGGSGWGGCVCPEEYFGCRAAGPPPPPPPGCAGLDERTCNARPECEAIYKEEQCGCDCPEMADCNCPPCEPQRWFVGCTDRRDGNCEGLPEYACQQAPNCAPEYQTICPDDCPDDPDPEPRDGGSTGMCACEVVYAGCHVRGPRPCEEIDDEWTCLRTPGCAPRYDYSDCQPGEPERDAGPAATPPSTDAICGAYLGCFPAEPPPPPPPPPPDDCQGLGERECLASCRCAVEYALANCAADRNCGDSAPVFVGCFMPLGPADAGLQTCTAEPPWCPQGFIPESGYGCWTGRCLPGPECPAPPPPEECVGIVDEATCIRTQGCEPVYSGLGCECTNGYCGCKEFVFTGCRPRDPQPL